MIGVRIALYKRGAVSEKTDRKVAAFRPQQNQ